MKIPAKYIILAIVCCILTVLTQIIYKYIPQADSLSYIELAKQYREFKFCIPSLENAQEGGHPMYIVFLSIIGSIFTYNKYIIAVIQTLLFCTSAFLLIRKLENYTNKDLTGLAIIIVLIPEIHFFNGSILTESFASSLMLLIFTVALGIYMRGTTLSKLFLLSLLLGTSILVRPESMACIFAVLFLLFPKIKERFILHSLIIISFPILLLGLIGVKNYETFHIFRVTALNGGEALYGGNSENLDGSHHVFELHKNIFIPKNKIDELNKIIAQPTIKYITERDSFYKQLAIEAWRKNPEQQLSVIPEKIAKDWLLPGIFDIYTNDTTKQRGLQIGKILSKSFFNNKWYAPYKHLFYMIVHWMLLFIIMRGILSIKKQNRFQITILILLVFYVFYAIPFCGLPRFHVAIFPLLLITFIPLSLVSMVNKIVNTIENRLK